MISSHSILNEMEDMGVTRVRIYRPSTNKSHVYVAAYAPGKEYTVGFLGGSWRNIPQERVVHFLREGLREQT